jgi:hypothetical protein
VENGRLELTDEEPTVGGLANGRRTAETNERTRKRRSRTLEQSQTCANDGIVEDSETAVGEVAGEWGRREMGSPENGSSGGGLAGGIRVLTARVLF